MVLIWEGDLRHYIVRCYSQSSTTGPFDRASSAKQHTHTHTHTSHHTHTHTTHLTPHTTHHTPHTTHHVLTFRCCGIVKTNTILCTPAVTLLWWRLVDVVCVCVVLWHREVMCCAQEHKMCLPCYAPLCRGMPRYALLCPVTPCLTVIQFALRK